MQVVETSLRVLGQEHPDTLSSQSILALSYSRKLAGVGDHESS